MPEDMYSHKGGTHEQRTPTKELGVRQDGFLPLLHIAELSLTLPVWENK